MSDLTALMKLVRRTRARMRVQLLVERATTMAVVAVALVIVGLYFYKARAIDEAGMVGVLLGAGGLVLGGAIWGAFTPVRAEWVLGRLDATHHTRSALLSAWDFLSRSEPPPSEATVALMRAEVARARRLLGQVQSRRAARFRLPRDLPALGVMSLALLGFLAMSLPAPSIRASVPPPVRLGAPPIQIDEDLYQEALDDLKDVQDLARHLKDENLLKFLRDYAKLLEALRKGLLTREEFEHRYKALMKKYFEGASEEAKNQRSILEQLARAGKALAQKKLTRKLGEALRKKDLDAARRELRKLAQKLDKGNLPRWQRKQLARALEKAARLLQRRDAMQLEKRIQRQRHQLQKQIQAAQRRLRQLRRRLNQARTPRQRATAERMFRKQQRRLEQLRRRAGRLRKQQRTLRRLARSMEDLAKQLRRQKMDAKTRAALQKLMQELSRYQNQAARGQARGQAQLTLKQLRELLKRLRNRRGMQKGRLSDYLNRARGGHGQKPCPTCKGTGRNPRGRGPCPTCKGSGRRGGLSPGGLRPGGLVRRGGGLRRGGGMQPGGMGPGKGGRKWGTGHDPNVHGRATNLDAKHRDEQARGKQGSGPSEAQVFQGAAERGFSSQSYRRVYVQYKKIWQKVLNQEEIPPGYRFLVERYFRLIKPR